MNSYLCVVDMSLVEEFNKAVAWAEYLGLPQLFPKMGTKTSPPGLPTLPTSQPFREEEARTPTSREVRGTQLPAVVIPPNPLSTGDVGAESSKIVPLRCQMAVNAGIWAPRTVVEKPGLLLQK